MMMMMMMLVALAWADSNSLSNSNSNWWKSSLISWAIGWAKLFDIILSTVASFCVAFLQFPKKLWVLAGWYFFYVYMIFMEKILQAPFHRICLHFFQYLCSHLITIFSCQERFTVQKDLIWYHHHLVLIS